jgi:hypothetical protein
MTAGRLLTARLLGRSARTSLRAFGQRLRRAAPNWVAALAAKRTRRGSFLEAMIVLASAGLTFIGIEAAYRWVLYHQLLDRYTRQVLAPPDLSGVDSFSALLHRSSTFDPRTGHRYKPNLRVDIDLKLENISPHRFRSNSHGHISDDEYPVAKPAEEYRIAVIGDSFTAGVTNSVRWPAEMERQLNASAEWKRRVGGKRTRAINCGLDGISAIQFQDVYDCEARRFDPDIVLINLIVDDLQRRPYYRGEHTGGMGEQEARQFVRGHVLAPLPWFNPWPEMLARKPVGRKLGLRPRLDPQFQRFYDNFDEGVFRSLTALRNIKKEHPRTLIFYQPTCEDLRDALPVEWKELRRRMDRDGTDLAITDMTRPMKDLIPPGMPLNRWYQIPHDAHPTDEGMRVYGAAAARAVMTQLR